MNVLQRARESFGRRRWIEAFEAFSSVDETVPLEPEDLWSLALSAYLIGRDNDFLRTMDRAHRAHLEAGEVLRAARLAFWVGFHFASQGEVARASGWLRRAARLVEHEGQDCVEHGYLLLPIALRHLYSGDYEASYARAADAKQIGERCAESDLTAFALHLMGCALVKQARMDDGLALLDEAMVSITAGELSPVVTGVIYCSTINACQEVFELRRCQEWTTALTQWCDGQPDLVRYAGQCLVHRAEIMQLHGEWKDALTEAERALERSSGVDQPAAAAAFYQQGEIRRLLGEFAAAERAYRDASRLGRDPQPGLALLRLTEGDHDAAAAAIRRVMDQTSGRLDRARFLPAYIEIMLAVGDREAARAGCQEFDGIAESFASEVLRAKAATAKGAAALTEGDARTALVALRHARQVWQELQAPYEAARVRVLAGLACGAFGDHDTARLELDAARDTFEQLAAAPDIARVHAFVRRHATSTDMGLTPREVEVLRLVATGKTNRAIAAELFLSERTVDRHVSNVFTKLGVSSRAAATAQAYEQQLL